jgi:transketolase
MRKSQLSFGPRRGVYVDARDLLEDGPPPLASDEIELLERFDLVYRSLCALLYNYVPMSGHPGGSISSGRFVQALLFRTMHYDLADPDREDADLISYAAGHKALGLYSLWALRNEIARIAAPELLPGDLRRQLRLEDLLGFRQSPTRRTPLFREFRCKALDGHPTPATPFLRLATGASGVGVASSLGLAFAAADAFGGHAPKVHVVEGEGGLTPGRVAEVLAAAGTASLGNAILHVDWNQASIDSNHVCRDGEKPGDYVQWDPLELAYLHDWNVIYVPGGFDFNQIVAAQQAALRMDNGQPTAIVYRTTKGWQYGIEGRASHGAGHKLCADAFFGAVAPLLEGTRVELPRCPLDAQLCQGGQDSAVIEKCAWDALLVVRQRLETDLAVTRHLAGRLVEARASLDRLARRPRVDAPRVEAVYEAAREMLVAPPEDRMSKVGSSATLRGELGLALAHCNRSSGGALLTAAADLLGSTSVNVIGESFAPGFYNARSNPAARTLSLGGICEDGAAGILSGISSFGHHVGVVSSYGAFLAPLAHVAARLHAIGSQARQAVSGDAFKPMVVVCAHAGLMTGEDGPTHADPQALQLLQENFPPGTVVTLTPWEPREIWTLVGAALAGRPAVIAPFVTRPNVRVPDRAALGLAPAGAAATGVYRLRQARGKADAVVVLQESGATLAFVEEALPLLEQAGIDLDVYCVASSELFDRLSPEEQERAFPAAAAEQAMGITGFTRQTMYRWIRSARGREFTLHPFQHGHYLASGRGEAVMQEAGLDGASQFEAIRRFLGRQPRA